jgi:hypothetical protein
MRIIEVKKDNDSNKLAPTKTDIRLKKNQKSLMLKIILILSLFNALVSGLLLIGVWRIIVEWAQRIL